jgi:hypothetical protein
MDSLREATTKFDLLGISLGRWTKPLGTKELFMKKAQEGCQIRILILSPENPAMDGLMNEEGHQGSIERTKQAIVETTEFFKPLIEKHEQIALRHIQNACPHQTMMFNDFHAVVIPYLYSNATFLSPLFDFPQKNSMYDVFASEFESLWEEASDPYHKSL